MVAITTFFSFFLLLILVFILVYMAILTWCIIIAWCVIIEGFTFPLMWWFVCFLRVCSQFHHFVCFDSASDYWLLLIFFMNHRLLLQKNPFVSRPWSSLFKDFERFIRLREGADSRVSVFFVIVVFIFTGNMCGIRKRKEKYHEGWLDRVSGEIEYGYALFFFRA